jgi:hypothetical protein
VCVCVYVSVCEPHLPHLNHIVIAVLTSKLQHQELRQELQAYSGQGHEKEFEHNSSTVHEAPTFT